MDGMDEKNPALVFDLEAYGELEDPDLLSAMG